MTSQNRREARRNLKGHENRIIQHCAKSKFIVFCNIYIILFVKFIFFRKGEIYMPKMLFCGYGNFKNKAKDKDLFMIKFLSPVEINEERHSADSQLVSVFTTKEKYSTFLKNHNLLDFCDVECRVSGERAFYSI